MEPDLTGVNDPWWARHRDKVLILSFVLLLLSGLGIVPSPVSRALDRMLQDHASMLEVLQVQCVHHAGNDRDKIEECLTGRLKGGR